MDELKFNKLFAGVLLAGLLLMAGIKAGDILVPSHDGHGHGGEHKNSYPIEVAEVADTGAAVAAPAGPCLLYTSPSPRDAHESRMPSSA